MTDEEGQIRSCNLCGKDKSKVFFTKMGYDLVRCPSCDLVYVNNPPSKRDLQGLYSFESGYHVGCRDGTADFEHWFDRAEHYYEIITKHKQHGRILDIGCGAGYFLKVARGHGWDTYGVEISKDTSDYARKRFDLSVITGTLEETNFEPRSFDVVTMWDLIEHVEDPMKTMSITNKILKDDGIVAITTPNIDGLFPKVSFMISKMIDHWPHPEPPHHLYQFSKKTISSLLDFSGFDVLEIHNERISLHYSFGNLKDMVRSPKRLLYTSFLVPFAVLGPIFHMGDWITVIAQKSQTRKGSAR